MNQINAKLVVGRVQRFFPGGRFGFAQANAAVFHFHMNACRKVVPGRTEPEFSVEPWGAWPNAGEEIVLLPDGREPLPGRALNAWRWGYKKYWEKVAAEIASRPHYRVMGENRFKGQVMGNGARYEIVVTGTLAEMCDLAPRGSVNDPLGTEEPYRSGPCQRINRWQRRAGDKDGTEIWEPCDDPRPLPSRIALETCQREQADANALAIVSELEALAVGAGGQRRGTKTPKPGQLVA